MPIRFGNSSRYCWHAVTGERHDSMIPLGDLWANLWAGGTLKNDPMMMCRSIADIAASLKAE